MLQNNFGHEEDYSDKEYALESWAEGDGGVMFLSGGEVPWTCHNLILEQFERFNVPYTERLKDVLYHACQVVFHFFDCYHPYALFFGISDVDITQEWQRYNYRIRDSYTGGYADADPQWLETYRFVPGQAEKVFNEILANPSFDGLCDQLDICGLGDTLLDEFSQKESIGSAEIDEIKRLFPEGDPQAVLNDYLKLTAWSAVAWMVGPLSRPYRRNNPIVDACLAHGEAVIYSGSILSPNNYERQERAPESCYRCGIKSWCIEKVYEDSYMGHVCEACLNESMPKVNQFTCGVKLCRSTICPHHPLHSMGEGAFREVMRQTGQLNAVARGEAPLGMKASRESLLLS